MFLTPARPAVAPASPFNALAMYAATPESVLLHSIELFAAMIAVLVAAVSWLAWGRA